MCVQTRLEGLGKYLNFICRRHLVQSNYLERFAELLWVEVSRYLTMDRFGPEPEDISNLRVVWSEESLCAVCHDLSLQRVTWFYEGNGPYYLHVTTSPWPRQKYNTSPNPISIKFSFIRRSLLQTHLDLFRPSSVSLALLWSDYLFSNSFLFCLSTTQGIHRDNLPVKTWP